MCVQGQGSPGKKARGLHSIFLPEHHWASGPLGHWASGWASVFSSASCFAAFIPHGSSGLFLQFYLNACLPGSCFSCAVWSAPLSVPLKAIPAVLWPLFWSHTLPLATSTSDWLRFLQYQNRETLLSILFAPLARSLGEPFTNSVSPCSSHFPTF